MTEIRIGISGWTYPPWRGDFYPPGLPHDREHGRDVFTYFDNDVKTHAPFDAISLGKRFGLTPNSPFPPPSSGRTA